MKTKLYQHKLTLMQRQGFYLLGGGSRDYVDIGFKAWACVNHDRKCAAIARGRAS